jgi:hypothetical protein
MRPYAQPHTISEQQHLIAPSREAARPRALSERVGSLLSQRIITFLWRTTRLTTWSSLISAIKLRATPCSLAKTGPIQTVVTVYSASARDCSTQLCMGALRCAIGAVRFGQCRVKQSKSYSFSNGVPRRTPQVHSRAARRRPVL